MNCENNDCRKRIPCSPSSSNIWGGDNLKVYDVFRDYVKQEDNLINFRSTWIVTIQGFLYATYGVILSKKFEALERITDLRQHFLLDVRALSGLERLDCELGIFLFVV